MAYKRKTCKCGHNKKAHGGYFFPQCRKKSCYCSKFQRKQKGEE